MTGEAIADPVSMTVKMPKDLRTMVAAAARAAEAGLSAWCREALEAGARRELAAKAARDAARRDLGFVMGPTCTRR